MADPLEVLAARAADEPFFLGWLLAAYADSEGLDDAGLAAALGCSTQALVLLRLCRAPRTDSQEFWDDVTCIAERFGLARLPLAEAVKRGRVVRRFRQAGQAAAGSLMAARDREGDTPPEHPGSDHEGSSLGP
jgi:hypothetical protein